MKKNSVTLSDIARELHMTAATVSRALSDHPEISAKTKSIVKEAAQRLDYKPNRIASSLRSGKTNVIGVLIPTAENAFFGSVIHGITNLASKHGYSVLIHECDELFELEVKGIQTFIGARVDGIIASLSRNTVDYDHFLDVKRRNIPLVFFDRVPDLDIPSVVIDGFNGSFWATQHLIDQGYKRIAHISGPLFINTFNDRFKGYEAALKANNIPFESDLVFNGNISIESGMEGTRQLLALAQPPDAIFAAEDFTALGVLKQLKINNIKAPDQFGIFGFCNDMFSEHTTPSLSTMDQQTVLMGQEAFKLLNQIIENGNEKTSDKIVVKPLPVIRESSLKTMQ
ncbi:LacI family DNA-binding transcriptional regulator [Dyadobacter sp. CY356]|uniref:LacI family DNA-binding transcriptional regulator n=1 Tax=Dyadobacter sp. CY356 TaxID=2906442 RepID=UPI001F1BBC21|nr:LacI family DNA-binding transcriptional regulator [Dyadobacter sp. CY356]MCF0055431.1 LacI family transcriptional regulator [Dyadobacter sp. CY356]